MKRIDPHRHLGGSISPKFVWNTISGMGLSYLAESYIDVHNEMVCLPNEPRTFHRFLDKFKILDKLPWTDNLIEESIKDVCDGLNADNIDYTWLRFSINKYLDHLKWHKYEIVNFIYDCFQKYAPGKVGLMLSLKYESTRASQRQYAALIDNQDIADKIIGIDLVGDEEYFDFSFYKPIFDDWNKYGKVLCVHAGESRPVDNIIDAIKNLHVKHVAHGIKIVDSQYAMDLAKECNICFDLALSSNHYTGVAQLYCHPIREMYDYGLIVTIGTDDPVQCNTNLSQEFDILEQIGFSDSDINNIQQNAVDYIS